MIAEFIDPTDAKWLSVLDEGCYDIYHLPDYCAVNAEYEGGEATAFFAQEGESRFLAPLIVKELPEDLGEGKGWMDAASPYGYSSPIVNPADNEGFFEKSMRSMADLCFEKKIVNAFFRLHPFFPMHENCISKHGTYRHIGNTVYIDLAISKDEFYSKMRKNHRENIYRILRVGYRCVINDWVHYEDFIRIYSENMKRVGSDEFYLFTEKYFYDLRQSIGEHMHLITVLSPEDQVAAIGIFFNINGLFQYHLGGTATDHMKMAPMKLLLGYAFEYGKNSGYRLLHLGGGVGGREDSLFHFKKGFSKLTVPFNTFSMVFNHDKHEELSNRWKEVSNRQIEEETDFFPVYRAPQ